MFLGMLTMACVLILSLLALAQVLLGSSSSPSDPQLSTLESGFEGTAYATVFSSSFLFLAVLFVLFDLELLLILSLLSFKSTKSSSLSLVFASFGSLIMVPLAFEWGLFGFKWHT